MASQRGLTQRQWLSIIMIATAFMILLFTIIGKILEKKLEPEKLSREPPFTALFEIGIGKWSAAIDSNSGECVQQPKILSKADCLKLIQNWQTFVPTATTNQLIKNPALTLILRLDSKQTWYLYLEPAVGLAKAGSNELLLLSPEQLKDLLPSPLLSYWRIQQSH